MSLAQAHSYPDHTKELMTLPDNRSYITSKTTKQYTNQIHISYREILGTARCLVERGRCGPMVGSHNKTSVLSAWLFGPADVLRWLLHQDEFTVEPVSQEAGGATIWYRHAYGLSVLWSQTMASEIVTATDNAGYTVLHAGLESFSSRFFAHDEYPELSPWAENITLLLKNCADIHARTKEGLTPLDNVLHAFHKSQARNTGVVKHRLDNLINWWFNTLLDCGFDLAEYVEQERTLHVRPTVYTLFKRDWEILRVSKTFHLDHASGKYCVLTEKAWEPCRCPL